jgi:signal transduction histidine kinase
VGVVIVPTYPARPGSTTGQLDGALTFGPTPGERIAADFCAAGAKPQGGWVEYNFPKPGETRPARKVSYLLAAPGTPYVAGAGLYDATTKVEDLDRLTGGQP